MTLQAGIGRTGLLALVAVVLLAHTWVLKTVSGAMADAPAARSSPPSVSHVRLVPAAPESPPPRTASETPPSQAAAARPATRPRPTAPTAAPAPVTGTPSPDAVDTTVAMQPPLDTPILSETAGPEPEAPSAATAADQAVTAAADPATNPATNPAANPAATPAPLPPLSLPPDADLKYQVQGQARNLRYRAEGELSWRQTGGGYELSMRLSAFLIGSRSQTSTGRIDATGLLPERFSDRARSEKAAHFDRAEQRIRFSNNAPDAPLLPGAQDRLSVFLQLAGLLQAGSVQAGDVLSLPVAGTSGSETWRFAVGEPESLELPAGTLMARRLVREPADTYDSRVEVWLAPELGHLPVRLRITQSQGDMADQQLSQRP